MKDLTNDKNVFIRSLASRGSLGGLSFSTTNIAKVFDAVGYAVILIETVGAGQSEVEIARLAHTTLVVEAPGMGDDIQAIKAGILEIADILVINKADRDGAEQTEAALRAMLNLDHPNKAIFHHNKLIDISETQPQTDQELWIPPIAKTIATEGVGFENLVEQIAKHLDHLNKSGGWKIKEREKVFTDLEKLLRNSLYQNFMDTISSETFNEIIRDLEARKISPQVALDKLLGRPPTD
jgi:LAO/AO transport system kinase